MTRAYDILTSHNKFHITLGLERIEKILALLDNPQNNFKVIHVAGTNGKGSTSKIINDILVEHFKNTDVKIGLFTSPHLFSYTERIKINNQNIPQKKFDKIISDIDNLALKNNIELSEFELLTAAAFYYFNLEKVRYVILEVGLGGLYDATNVVTAEVCAITTIDFDHTERLGKTIEQIALQKAGIIKKGCSVAILKDNLGFSTIEKVICEKEAKILDCPKVEVNFKDKNIAKVDGKEFEFNLLGSHQAQNLSLAMAAINFLNLNITDKTIETALKNVVWPFRLEYDKSKNLLVDSAHNPSGIKSLRNFLDENFEGVKKKFIFGCLKNKDYKTMLKTLINKDDELYFFEFSYPNALKYDELPDELKSLVKEKLTSIERISEIIDSDCLKIVCGSIYMLGNLFKIH